MYHFCPEKFIGEWNYESFHKNAVSDSDIVQVLMPEYIQTAQRLHPTTKILCIPNVAPFQGNDSLPLLTSKKLLILHELQSKKDQSYLSGPLLSLKINTLIGYVSGGEKHLSTHV